ncbi:MAG: D-glycero-beta-D-manno-heptose 1-phosphate adenylyltransferase [Alphaproteobacteria bacterium]
MKKNQIKKSILCVGDIILDSYQDGKIDRISPEAPIPVLKILRKDKKFIGGSGNVARNISAAGESCHLISVIGVDENAITLRKLCKEIPNLSVDLIKDKNRPTTFKKRFVSGSQQILRVDEEKNHSIDISIEKEIIKRFEAKISEFKVVVISDYNKGMLTKSLLKKIITFSKKKNKIVIVDPKNDDFSIYGNANIITPNLKELLKATRSHDSPTNKNIEVLSKRLISKYKIDTIITTRSADGISIISKKAKTLHLPSKAKEVFDVSGAGDTVVSYLASGILRDKSLGESVKLANEAASIAVAKFGTATVKRIEVNKKIYKSKKVCSLSELIEEIKNSDLKKVGFTNGCFDLLHQGHLDYLKQSRDKCDFLILGLNSDLSVKILKGKKRPIIKQKERAEILSNFDFIDRIVIFNERTPINLIKKIKPIYLFKGSDYKREQVVGSKEIKKWGGKVILINYLKGKSTSKIIERIQNGT